MSKQRVADAVETIGHEPLDVDVQTPAPPQAVLPRPPERLKSARVVRENERAYEYPGGRRFRVRALGGGHPARYVVTPGDAASAEAEYLRHLGLDAKALNGMPCHVTALPD